VLREIKILRLLNNHPNLLQITDLIAPPQRHKLTDLYICTPLMESDLHQIIFSDNELSENHQKYFTCQILQVGCNHRSLL
jgi:mitogen-activated protein kinase 1/3